MHTFRRMRMKAWKRLISGSVKPRRIRLSGVCTHDIHIHTYMHTYTHDRHTKKEIDAIGSHAAAFPNTD